MAYKYYKKRKSTVARLRALELQSRLNRPEMKTGSYANAGTGLASGTMISSSITNLIQGTDSDQRTGNQIRVHQITVRFRSTSTSVDHFLLMTPGNHTPGIGDFHSVPNCTVDHDQRHLLKTLRHYCRSGDDEKTSSFVWRSRRGVLVSYNGPTSTNNVLNRFWYVLKNETGATVSNFTYSIEMKFTDA